MAKESKSTVTPRLRFPEFWEADGWKTERMGELYSFMRNNALSRDKLNYENGAVKNIHYGDIHTKFSALFDITKECVPYINSTEELPGANSEDYCVEGDVIFADASEDTNDVGKSIEIIRLNDERLLSGQHTILARQKDGALIVGFGGHLFQSGQIRSQIQKESQGTKVYAISSTRLSSIEISYPNDEAEQQKIAACLTSLDDVIAAQGRKVEALKTWKCGLMQQLFPREGETLPRLRFPEFHDAPEWELKLLNEVADINPKRENITDETLISFVPMSAVSESGYLVDPQVRLFFDVKKGYTFFRDHDIIFAKITPCFENGKAALLNELMNGVGVGSTEFHVVRARKLYFPEFLFACLYTNSFRQLGKSAMTGSAGQQRVPAEFLERYPLSLPKLAEQQKIADCLSFFDTKITVESEKLDALKTHKKGLMQKLFPSPEVD